MVNVKLGVENEGGRTFAKQVVVSTSIGVLAGMSKLNLVRNERGR
jgi:hypothetical protein